MKKTLLISLSIILFAFTQLNAQTRRAKVVRHKTHRATVAKNNKSSRVTQAKRRRVKRTTAVHHHYKHLPRRGAIVTTVSTNSVLITHRGVGYKLHSGVWYKPVGVKWVVTRPLRGTRIKTLPIGCRKTFVSNRTYHYYYGTFYEKKGSEYEIVNAPIGADVDSLPEGYKTIKVHNEEYYELDGSYYIPSTNEEGEEILVVVNNPIK